MHEFLEEYQWDSRALLKRHWKIFDGNGPLQQTRFVMHNLKLTSEKPFRLPPYHYAAEKKKAIQ
jgi:hypothetical protein